MESIRFVSICRCMKASGLLLVAFATIGAAGIGDAIPDVELVHPASMTASTPIVVNLLITTYLSLP